MKLSKIINNLKDILGEEGDMDVVVRNEHDVEIEVIDVFFEDDKAQIQIAEDLSV